MTDRGHFKNRENARQLVTFQNMRFGNITPTDIDVFMDFGDKLFVIGEAKYGDAQLPFGQRLAIERLCDAAHNPPHRYATAFILRHEETGDVDVAATRVTKYRWNNEWRSPIDSHTTFRDGVLAILAHVKAIESPLKVANQKPADRAAT